MALKQAVMALFLLVLLLAACDLAGNSTTPVTNSSAALTPTSTPRQKPTATSQPTSTPSPTPISPALTVDSQELVEDGRLTLANVALPEAGWAVVFADEAGEPGDVLGYTAVSAGNHANLEITIDPKAATANLFAQLHQDVGQDGTFEYPGPDSPITTINPVPFEVDIQLPFPIITIEDQEIDASGMITVARVFSEAPGWLVIHAQEPNGPGPILGQYPIPADELETFSFPIQWRQASSELLAVLYTDSEQTGGFDPANDRPLIYKGQPVTAVFEVKLPPDIHVYDQPVINGALIVQRVSTQTPSWLVVYTIFDELPGPIIGFELLEAGVNENVVVEVVETAVTPQLLLQLHEDGEPLGEFDFPAGDPLLMYNGDFIEPLSIKTTPGNYLLTQDQTLGIENTVTVPLVVTDLDTWLVIYTSESNRPDTIIGQTWLPAGVNQDITVTIDPATTTETLLAVLHQDVSTPQEFDYPDGLDTPLQRNRTLLFSPFNLNPPSDQ